MSPLAILRQSSKLTLATIAGMLLTIPANLWVANQLGPEMLGKVNFVVLFLMYATLIRPGFFEGGSRELIHALGLEHPAEALKAQNTGFTLDLLFALIPAAALGVAAMLTRDPILRIGFAIAPVACLAMAVARMLTGFQAARQRFGFTAALSFGRASSKTLLLCVFVALFGGLGVFLAPAIAEVSIVIAVLAGPAIGLRLSVDRKEAGRLFRIGLPLSLGAFIYWAYRMIGSTTVALGLPAEALGLYQFANQTILLAIVALSDFSAVLLPVFWTEAARKSSLRELSKETTRISIFVMFAACAIANLAQAGFAPIVDLYLPKFVRSAPVFGILAFDIVVLTMTFLPSLALDSALVNRQRAHWTVWGIALAVNAAANATAIYFGRWLSAIAWNDVWIQILVVIVLFGLAQEYLFQDRREARALYAKLAALAFVCFATWLILPALTVADPLVSLVLRSTFVLAIWTAVASLAIPRRQESRSRPRLLLYSDCYMFAGSENMPAILLDDEKLNQRFDVDFAYRWTPWYQSDLEYTVARRDGMWPLHLPVPPHDQMGRYHRSLSFWPMWLASKLYLFFAYDVVRLFLFFRQRQPDILHVNNGGYPAADSARAAVLGARLAGVRKIILHVNSKAAPRPREPRVAIEWLIDTLVAGAITRYACGSQPNVERMALRGFPRAKGIVLFNTPHPKKARYTPKQIDRPDCALFLAVGHLQRHKGHGVLIEAARLLRDELHDSRAEPTFHVWIEGFGECRAEYEAMLADANLYAHVSLIGRVAGIQDYMRACDVFVHPSYGPDDLPNVISEALQLGKPIIATDHVGIPTQVTASTGLLVEPNNAPQLARAMRTLLQDAALCARLAEGAQTHFERTFSYRAVVPQYLRLYEELLGGTPSAALAETETSL